MVAVFLVVPGVARELHPPGNRLHFEGLLVLRGNHHNHRKHHTLILFLGVQVFTTQRPNPDRLADQNPCPSWQRSADCGVKDQMLKVLPSNLTESGIPAPARVAEVLLPGLAVFMEIPGIRQKADP